MIKKESGWFTEGKKLRLSYLTPPPPKCFRAIISKNVRNWRPQMSKTNFNKVSTLWTYMENMSTALNPDKISFGVLFFEQKLLQFRTFLKLLPHHHCHRHRNDHHIYHLDKLSCTCFRTWRPSAPVSDNHQKTPPQFPKKSSFVTFL